jgi:hypothetical protein
MKRLALAAGALVLLSGCATSQHPGEPKPGSNVGRELMVADAPPPPVVEEVTVSPGAGYVWIAGEWNWQGHWVWESGHWARPPRPGMTWVPNKFVYRRGKPVFIQGGWK